MSLFYISFATTTAFLGATVVEADHKFNALSVATSLGLNPGGEAAVFSMPEGIRAQGLAEMKSYQNRLVGKEELISNGARRKGDLPAYMQDRFDQEATFMGDP